MELFGAITTSRYATSNATLSSVYNPSSTTTLIRVCSLCPGQVPEKLAAHAYKICHWNPDGYVQRDSVSCRREHRNSPMGRFTPGFNTKTGNPISRSGYMVPCKRTSDCYSRCPAHVLTGDRYQCQKNYILYDVAYTDDDGNIEMVSLSEGNTGAFDSDPITQAITGEYGICVDVDSSMNQGCPDKTMSGIVDAVIGCFDREISFFLCGLEVDIKDGDTTTASIEGNFLYIPPRVLVAAGADHDGDGNPSPAITCGDPVDCNQVRSHHIRTQSPKLTVQRCVSVRSQKCRLLERTSSHGAGAPPACALCDQ